MFHSIRICIYVLQKSNVFAKVDVQVLKSCRRATCNNKKVGIDIPSRMQRFKKKKFVQP